MRDRLRQPAEANGGIMATTGPAIGVVVPWPFLGAAVGAGHGLLKAKKRN